MRRRYRKPKPLPPATGDPFFKPLVQQKLKVGQPGDKYEREADVMADQVVNRTGEQGTIQKMEGTEDELQQKPLAASVTPLIQRMETTEEENVQAKCDDCEKEETVQKMAEEEEPVQKMEEEEDAVQMMEEEEAVQARSNNPNPSPSIEPGLRRSKGRGSKLSGDAKSQMEQGFGADFSHINIHTDSEAVQMSQELGAQAFTYGNDVYFNTGKYDPNSKEGKHLLAHELTHTIQQEGSIRKKEDPSEALPVQQNPLVGLKRGDGLVFGTWHLRPRVKILQQKLNEKMGSRLKIDGMFGPNTGEILRGYKAIEGSEMTSNLFATAQSHDGDEVQQAGFEKTGDGLEVVDRKTADSLMGARSQREVPLLDDDTMFVLSPPPVVCQGDSLVCWAAAGASWLNATKILPGATRDSLIIRFGHCICDDGSLPEKFVSEVYGELGIGLFDVANFDYEFLKSNLKSHGHIILIIGGNIGHAVVAYGVGVSDTGTPDRDFYSIFDPIDCKYHNHRFGDQDVVQIGKRAQLGPRAVCADVDVECG
ncbi:DUF4157 domain-containing protein [Seonamhaeicola sp.]|uniref:eCIS core domain-containing protein n=1 Tax=Seonamhaeicola sp. TaxID=1912245 RepID=UPI002626F175|nr:DUF4157 domain-containing protein [Seonamhaeicola sp.]